MTIHPYDWQAHDIKPYEGKPRRPWYGTTYEHGVIQGLEIAHRLHQRCMTVTEYREYLTKEYQEWIGANPHWTGVRWAISTVQWCVSPIRRKR